MKFSIGILAQDEGRDLEVTVAQAWASDPAPHEVIVIDDGSTTPVQPRLASFNGVRCIRHKAPTGVHAGIRTFLQAATGDAAVILGGHMRMPLDWLAILEDELITHPNAIHCPVVRGFNVGSQVRGSGASFVRSGKILSWIGLQWLPRDPDLKNKRVPALLGACYVATMDSWRAIGGGNHPCMRWWGYLEADLALRAWLCNIECRCINRLVIAHRFYRPKVGKAKVEKADIQANLLHMVSALFGEEQLQRFAASVGRVYGDGPWNVYQAQRELDLRERARMAGLIKRPLSDLQALCGFTLPSDEDMALAEQKMIEELAKAKAAA